MKPPGTYKLLGGHRARRAESALPCFGGALRAQRIVDSLRFEIENNEAVQSIRIRQVFSSPREVFRVEIDAPDLSYQRTTLLDRDALEELLEVDGVRDLVADSMA